MEDEEDNYRPKINRNKRNDIFKIDYQEERFSLVYNAIKEVFDSKSGYLNFIRNVKDPLIKEIYVLMRKYQYFFSFLKFNELTIFNFLNDNKFLLDEINPINQSHNNHYEIQMTLLPKFLKDELNFEIYENIFSLKIDLYSHIEKSRVEIKNIKRKESVQINEITSKLLIAYLRNYPENLFMGLNKFLTYLENSFPEIHKKAIESYLLNKDIWSQEEQDKLEEALRKFSEVKDLKEKFKQVSEFVGSKSINDCVTRYKKLVSYAKANNKEESVNNRETKAAENKQIEANIINKKQPEIKTQPENNLKTNSKLPIAKKEVKIKVNKPSEKNENKEKKEDLVAIPKKEVNTADLVDDIINQFNSIYGEVQFQENENMDENLLHLKQDQNEDNNQSQNSSEYENEEEEEDYSEGDPIEGFSNYKTKQPIQIDSNEVLDEQYIKNENKKQNKIPISNNIVGKDKLSLVSNILKMGEKNMLNLTGVIINKIALVEVSDPKLFIKCAKCKQVGFETHFQKFNKNSNMFYMGSVCPKCSNEMFLIFKSTLLHAENLTNAGIIFSVGVIIIDILQSGYTLNCFDCPDTYKKVRLRTGGLSESEKKCRSCNKELTFYIYSGSVGICSVSDYSFYDETEINNFQKFNYQIESEDSSSWVKKYDKVIQQGNPLPDKGTCKHYKNSFRWFRFGCCSKVFPCDICHDEICNHECEHARTILCGLCAFEQDSGNRLCCKCGHNFFKVDSGKGFWEGGKGCRNKAMMSNKDGHKFKNSKFKTVSRKKREEKEK